ncbi:MAG TPA: phosphate ABC transporter permease subunit PstC, partial [Thermomonas sp.]|nr:phosphate ABC transporter permease subunit PstC [Thermomonas sp.]
MNAIAPTVPDDARDRADIRTDNHFRWLVTGAGVFVLVALAAAALSMLWGGREAFQKFGIAFLWTDEWDAVQQQFGALVPIYGTLVTAFIAMLIAVPISFGIAFFLTEIAPKWLRTPVGAAIELLAGIPSIIYGMWGLFVLVP